MTGAAIKPQPQGIPKAILIGAAVLIVVTIVGAGLARVTGFGRSEPPMAQAVETLSLHFEDQPDGSVLVRRAPDRVVIFRVAPETNGFIRATVRGLARERQRENISDEVPFVLTAWGDGRVTLDDTTTGRRVSLEAFGATNVGAFAQLFRASGAAR